MIRRATLNKGVVALWCLAAAGCGRVPDEVAIEEVSIEGEVSESKPADAAARDATETADSAAAVAPTEPAGHDSLDPPAAESLPTAPQAATADSPSTTPEHAAVAPMAPAQQEPEPEPVEPAATAAAPAAGTLDVAGLFTRLRKTKAINLRTKLAVKNESDDLLERFRAYHAQDGTATLAELRRSYDSLFLKLHSLLEDADPPLARDIDRSRGTIWTMLADPSKFGAPASPRGAPKT